MVTTPPMKLAQAHWARRRQSPARQPRQTRKPRLPSALARPITQWEIGRRLRCKTAPRRRPHSEAAGEQRSVRARTRGEET